MANTFHKRWFWIAAVSIVLAAIFGVGLWGRFHYWLYFGKGDEATKTQAISAGVQAATAVILLFVTGYYAMVTRRALDAAKRQADIASGQLELGQKQLELEREQFVWRQNEFQYSVKQDELRRNDFEQQLRLGQAQLDLTGRHFKASMIPRVFLKVYPSLDNYQHIDWQIRNMGNQDVLIQAAEIRWNEPGLEWAHQLVQYIGGVLGAGEDVSNRLYNVVPIPDDKWPKDRPMMMDDVVRQLTIAVTVSDVAKLLTFRFEFTPGTGQTVTVVGDRSSEFRDGAQVKQSAAANRS